MSSDAFVQAIIQAAGGLEKFHSVDAIETKFNFTGALLQLKGRASHLVVTASVSTHESKVTFTGLGGAPDEQWVYTPAKVWKQRVSADTDTLSPTIFETRSNPRDAFHDHTLETPWDDFHLLYFAGYALWQYFTFPFFLAQPEITTKELAPFPVPDGSNQTWRVLEVTFPADQTARFASHSRVQRYFFDDAMVLQRHDYAPDVLAGSPAAHFSYDDVQVGGWGFATLRRVVATVPPTTEGGAPQPMRHGPVPSLILLVFRRIELRGKDGGSEGAWSLQDGPGQ